MRAVVQRVTHASVTVDGSRVAEIGPGLCVLVGVEESDRSREARIVAEKVATMRVFGDESQKMNRSVMEVGGSVLIVSQFTLLADLRRGRRPSFTKAAAPSQAVALIDAVVDHLQAAGLSVETGAFGAKMSLELVNDGPVTIVLDVHDGKVR